MKTVNVSLPEALKAQAQELISQGYYVSFSDVVRDSLRRLVSQNRYDLLAQQAKEEERMGKTKEIKSDKQVDELVDGWG